MKATTPALTCLLALHAPLAAAQSTCSSDGQPQPVALYERFINADCESCWASAPAQAPGPSALVVDWIVPGSLGDDAPLAAAATTDALARLQELQRQSPAGIDTHISEVGHPADSPGRLRVAAGPAVNDYLGTGIRLIPRHGHAKAPGSKTHYQFTLVLVEAIPAGAEGSPVARNVARNALQGTWNERNQLSKQHMAWMENRPMRIADGARPERLHVVGWLQDAQGQVIAAAQAICR